MERIFQKILIKTNFFVCVKTDFLEQTKKNIGFLLNMNRCLLNDLSLSKRTNLL